MAIRTPRVSAPKILTCLFLWVMSAGSAGAQTPRFEVIIPASVHAAPVTGRLVLIVARSAQPEPRLAISPQGPAIFGVDLEQLQPGRAAIVDARSTSYPAPLSELPPGDYFVQAVVNVYDRVQRGDGQMLWLPVNDGTIEFFTAAAGNLYSEVKQVRVEGTEPIRIELTQRNTGAATRHATQNGSSTCGFRARS